MNIQTKGILLILISSLMFGSYGVWSKLIGGDFGNFYQGWTRALIIVIFTFPFLYFTKQIIPIPKKDWKWLGIFLLFTSGTQAPLFYAYNNMDIGTATLLFFVSMLITMYTVGLIFLGEKLNKVKFISFVLAILGLVVTFKLSLTVFAIFAGLMAILNGIASGGEVSFSKKLTGNYSALYVTWLSWLVILITNAPISILIGEIQHVPSLSMVWLWQIGYTIASLLGFYLIIKGLKSVEASIGGLLGLLEIVSSIIFGIIIFNEGLSMQVIIGGSLIITAAALPHIYERFKTTPATLTNQ